MIVTSHGRNKNLDDGIKETKRRPITASAIASRPLIAETKNLKNCENSTHGWGVQRAGQQVER